MKIVHYLVRQFKLLCIFLLLLRQLNLLLFSSYKDYYLSFQKLSLFTFAIFIYYQWNLVSLLCLFALFGKYHL